MLHTTGEDAPSSLGLAEPLIISALGSSGSGLALPLTSLPRGWSFFVHPGGNQAAGTLADAAQAGKLINEGCGRTTPHPDDVVPWSFSDFELEPGAGQWWWSFYPRLPSRWMRPTTSSVTVATHAVLLSWVVGEKEKMVIMIARCSLVVRLCGAEAHMSQMYLLYCYLYSWKIDNPKIAANLSISVNDQILLNWY